MKLHVNCSAFNCCSRSNQITLLDVGDGDKAVWRSWLVPLTARPWPCIHASSSSLYSGDSRYLPQFNSVLSLFSFFFFFLLFPHIFYQLPSGPSRFDRTVTPARCPWDRTHRAPCQRNGAKRWSPPNSEHAVAVRSERQQELRCCPGSTRVWFPFVCRPVSLFPPVCADCHGRQSSCGVKDIEHRIESIAFDPDTGSHFP